MTMRMMPGAVPRLHLNEMNPAQLRERVTQLEDSLRAQGEDPRDMAGVIDRDGAIATIRTPDGMRQVRCPPHLDVQQGMVVALGDKRTIVGIIPKPAGAGLIATVLRVEDAERHWALVQVKGDPGERIAIYPGEPPREDDQILLDESHTVIVQNLGPKKNELEFGEETGVSWDDIGGQEKAKRELIEAVEEPITHAELYERFGKKRIRGILLHGRPGCGKTLAFKAIATAMARLHGQSAREGGLISVRGPEVLSHWQGMSEAGIRGLFTSARVFYKRYKYPPVIAIDEADALLGKRGGRVEGAEKTIVPQWLAEMDGMGEMNALVILATNRPDVLDPAVTRDGRIDVKIEMGPPNRADFAAIVGRALRGKPLADVSAEQLGADAAKHVFEDRDGLYMLRMENPVDDRRVTLADFVSGALAVGIAERATKLAIRRAITKDGPDGITPTDLVQAVHDKRDELGRLDHENEIRAVVETYPHGAVKKVERVARGAKT